MHACSMGPFQALTAKPHAPCPRKNFPLGTIKKIRVNDFMVCAHACMPLLLCMHCTTQPRSSPIPHSICCMHACMQTYAGTVEVEPGPRLNLVLGPNGRCLHSGESRATLSTLRTLCPRPVQWKGSNAFSTLPPWQQLSSRSSRGGQHQQQEHWVAAVVVAAGFQGLR